MAQQQPARRKMQPVKVPVSIPDKLYFRIGDVARLCGLPPYVLRFWETEFPQLKPHKGGSGQRLYRKRDVEMVLDIKHLLYGEGFTIAGARRLLVEKRHASTSGQPSAEAGNHQELQRSESLPRPAAVATGKATRVAASASKPVVESAQFLELRKEMRDLLSMLRTEENQVRAVAVASSNKRKKKAAISNEPTLF